MRRRDLPARVGVFACVATLCVGTLAVAAPPTDPSQGDRIYYFKQARPLTRRPGELAVFAPKATDDQIRTSLSAASDAAAEVSRGRLAGWFSVTFPNDGRTAEHDARASTATHDA